MQDYCGSTLRCSLTLLEQKKIKKKKKSLQMC